MKRIIYITILSALLFASFGLTTPAVAAEITGTGGGSTSTGTPTLTSSTSYEPRPGDEKLIRGKVFIDYAKSKLVVNAGEPTSVHAVLYGHLPSPCHQLRVAVKPVDAKNGIFLEAYSLVSTGVTCIPMLQPFTASIFLGSFSKGEYSVYVNGQILGKFSVGSIAIQ